MSSVNIILADRALGTTRAQRRRAGSLSLLLHLALVASVWLATTLGDQRHQKRPVAAIVRVVTPAALGIKRPPPPPPPPQHRPPSETPPPPAPPPPEPAVQAPVIAVKKKTPAPTAVPPPPPPAVPPASTPEPPKRRGVLRGNPLGSSHSAAVGVEDPDFTYGYYVNQLVAALSSNWRRPPVPERIRDVRFYFRILRNGTLGELRMIDSSGSRVFDDAAQRAIEISTLPPLPRSYAKDYLGITVVMR